jgi:hypothetical protein
MFAQKYQGVFKICAGVVQLSPAFRVGSLDVGDAPAS